MATRPTPSAAQRTLLAILICVICLPASAAGSPTATLKASLHPELLGNSTTIKFAFSLAYPREAPSPLRVMELRYPAHLGIATSGLGLSTCRAAILEVSGPPGCPSTSVMGYGSGTVEVPFGPQTVDEEVHLTTFMAPLHNGQLGLLFYTYGEYPVSAELIFQGAILQTNPPFGGNLTTNVPLVSTLPEAPDAILTRFSTTIGPERITYWEYRNSHYIPYHPRGILLPPHCPHGGFPFAATFTFQNGAHTSARAIVPCPGNHRPARTGRV